MLNHTIVPRCVAFHYVNSAPTEQAKFFLFPRTAEAKYEWTGLTLDMLYIDLNGAYSLIWDYAFKYLLQ